MSSRVASRASATQAMGAPLELPPYEPQIGPLHDNAKRKVEAVINSTHTRHIKVHLSHAAGALSETVGEANDRLSEAKSRFEKVKRRRREREEKRLRDAEGEGSEQDKEDGEEGNGAEAEAEKDAEREEKLARFEELVKETTRKMERSMRSVVDTEVRVDKMQDLLAQLLEDNSTQTQTQNQQRARRSRRNQDEDGDADMNDDEQEEEDELQAPVEVIPASRVFADGLAENKRAWEALSLAERYGSNNSYKQFYRVIHESKHSGTDVPPLPPVSTWFQTLDSSREPGSHSRKRKKKRTRSALGADGTFEEDANEDDQEASSQDDNGDEEGDDDDDDEGDEGDEEEEEEDEAPTQEATQAPPSDDEIVVKSEKFSLTCPLTLQTFEDPATSTKCPHSFERSAIENMISRSRQTTFVPGAGRNMRCVECPVCSVMITVRDLKSDPVLVQRVKRARRMAALEEEEDDGDDGDGDEDLQERDASVLMSRSKTARGERVVVKSERTRSPSRIPDTQMDG
ncbi:uncharacterized protein GIQ15_00837 [Arthroderma uncinatum]|uniref:uncharacterized protein n=1 Tax=Arthroderma uncinatum TaxID=74035 RepID=UPI00144A7506|nr:uncharacterized protein GIQ15_00837 [Arthroderma uncinatum]KAF3491320.1 hypothetical protein GIQ15_00837 [Arthroderma uncinatum]